MIMGNLTQQLPIDVASRLSIFMVLTLALSKRTTIQRCQPYHSLQRTILSLSSSGDNVWSLY